MITMVSVPVGAAPPVLLHGHQVLETQLRARLVLKVQGHAPVIPKAAGSHPTHLLNDPDDLL
jgi:hypothetical protein